MRNRIIARVTAVVAATVVPLLVSAGPALAKIKPDDGEVPGHPLGVGNTLLLFVVIPVGAFLVIAGLAVLPSTLSRPRYRPGKPWSNEPQWISPPPDAESAAGSTSTAPDTARGGASAEW